MRQFWRFWEFLRGVPWEAWVLGGFIPQANRLLRENWGGTQSVEENPVTGDPQITERGALQLAQELVTLNASTAPIEVSNPVTFNQQPGLPALTINGSQQPLDLAGQEFPPPPAITINGGAVNIGGTTINIGGDTFDNPTTVNIGGNTTIKNSSRRRSWDRSSRAAATSTR